MIHVLAPTVAAAIEAAHFASALTDDYDDCLSRSREGEQNSRRNSIIVESPSKKCD